MNRVKCEYCGSNVEVDDSCSQCNAPLPEREYIDWRDGGAACITWSTCDTYTTVYNPNAMSELISWSIG